VWQLGKLEVDRRHKADSTLSRLINRAESQLDNKLDAHVLRYKESRVRNPAWHPSWTDKVKIRNMHADHRAIMAGTNIVSRVDSTPSIPAMQFRSFLRSSTHTAGGAPRKITAAKLAAFAARQNRHKSLSGMEVPEENPHASIFGSTGPISRLNTATHPQLAGLPDLWSMTHASVGRPESRENLPRRRGQEEKISAEVPFECALMAVVSRAGTPMSEHRISTPSMSIDAISGDIPPVPAGAMHEDDSDTGEYSGDFE